LDEATFHCREALRIEPEAFEAHLNLGRILADTSELDEAIKHLSEAVRLRPEHAIASYHLGFALEKQEKSGQAVRRYVDAVKSRPDLVPALLSLASIRATTPYYDLRNGEEAVELAEKACQLTKYTDPWALDVLAAAYAETGRFSEALRLAGTAMQLARASGNEKRAIAVQQRIELYRQEKSFRRAAPFDP
jgi:tetratricopeptide (TPR) repeat protein